MAGTMNRMMSENMMFRMLLEKVNSSLTHSVASEIRTANELLSLTRLLLIAVSVSLFLKVSGVRCAFDFGTDRSCVFLNDAQFLMLADKA